MKIKWLMAITFIVIGIIVASLTLCEISKIPASFPLVDYSEVRKEAMKLKVESASIYFNLTLALLAFLWVVFIVEKEKLVKLADAPAILMFGMANAFLLLCIYFNIFWKERLIQATWSLPLKGEKMPDILCEHFDSIIWAQGRCFIFAIAVTATLFITARMQTQTGGRI